MSTWGTPRRRTVSGCREGEIEKNGRRMARGGRGEGKRKEGYWGRSDESTKRAHRAWRTYVSEGVEGGKEEWRGEGGWTGGGRGTSEETRGGKREKKNGEYKWEQEGRRVRTREGGEREREREARGGWWRRWREERGPPCGGLRLSLCRARPAFLNLCPRMPLVMPICDAFEPVNRAVRNFDTVVHHNTPRTRNRRNARDLGPLADIYVVNIECKFVLMTFPGSRPISTRFALAFKIYVCLT